MPSPTYTLIRSETLASDAASIDFTSISQSYYDLRFHYSIRVTGAVQGADINVTFNNASNVYRGVIMYPENATNTRGYAVGATSSDYAAMIWAAGGNVPGASTPSGTFSNGRGLVPGYTNSTNLNRRSFGTQSASATSNNNSPSSVMMSGNQRSNGEAVNRVTFTLASGFGLMAAGSTISLYGCSNTVT
jgi:hypothetical protein